MSSVTGLMNDWRAEKADAESALLKQVYPVIKQNGGRNLRDSF
jgi:hypothetical protein